MVVLDPFTYESAWLLDTAGRILLTFAEADCRTCFLVTASEDEAREFLGPWGKELLVFIDPDREVVKAIGLTELPAFVHIDIRHVIEGKAEGWQPNEWREVAAHLATVMSWKRPEIPMPNDPNPFPGSAALG